MIKALVQKRDKYITNMTKELPTNVGRARRALRGNNGGRIISLPFLEWEVREAIAGTDG